MGAERTSLAAELAPIQKQIERTQEQRRLLEGELRSVLAEIEAFSADKQRFDALRDVCSALDVLAERGAGDFFWGELPGGGDAAGHLARLRDRIARFEGETRGTQEKHDKLKAEINKQQYRLNLLQEETRRAYAREARRDEELLVEREISPRAFRTVLMPWSSQEEDERRYRKAVLVALLFCLFFGSLIPLVKLPALDRSAVVEVPERLVTLVKQEKSKPEPPPERLSEEKKSEKDLEKEEDKPKEEQPKPTTEEALAARKKAESAGVLAFKETFSDLMDETPVAGLPKARVGGAARLSNQSAVAAGSSRATRSLIAVQSTGGSSGGIGNAGVSRNIGSGNGSGGRLGSVAFTRVESSVAGLAEETRPLSSGPGPARTDEEIQIVFDKYKATLYRIYNAELRKNPTLRGKMILRITIEPGGEVSACTVQSSDLASPELAAQIVERVGRFNFGPKEEVSRITILYPIDFLPGG